MYDPMHTVFNDFKFDKDRTVYLAVKKMGVVNMPLIGMVLDLYHPIDSGKTHRPEQIRRILNRLERQDKIDSGKLSVLAIEQAIRNAIRTQKRHIENAKRQIDKDKAKYLLEQEIADIELEFATNPHGDPTVFQLSSKARKAEGIHKKPGVGKLGHRFLGNYFLLHITASSGRDWFTHTVTEHEVATTNFEKVTNSSGESWKVNDYTTWGKLADCFISFHDGNWTWVEVENSEKPSRERTLVASIRPRLGRGAQVSHLYVVDMIIVHGYPESARWMLDSFEEHSLSNYEKYLVHGTSGSTGIDEEIARLEASFHSRNDFVSYIIKNAPRHVFHYFMGVTQRLAITKHIPKEINELYFWHPLSYLGNQHKKENYLSINRIREIERELGWQSPMTRKKRYLTDLFD